MRHLRLLAILALVLGLAGCWSRRELTEVSFAGTLGLDWADGQYQVTVNLLSPRTAGGAEQPQGRRAGAVWNVTEQAPALDEALARIDQVVARSLVLAHVRTVIFGEDLARQGIGPAIDFLLRSVEVRPTVWIGVTSGRAADLLQANLRQEPFPANGPLGYHDLALGRSSLSPAFRLTEVANILQEEGVDLTLPLFRRGNADLPRPDGGKTPSPDNAGEIIFGGAGVFRGDRLVAWLSPVETRGLLWGLDRIVHGAVSVPCPDPERRVVFRLRRAEGHIQARQVGRRIQGFIRVRVVADLNELGCREPLVRVGDPTPLEKLLAGQVRSEIERALAQSRQFRSDIFGLGQSLFRGNPRAFKQRAATWGNLLATMPISVEVQARVARLGQINARYRPEEDPGRGEESGR